MGRFAQRHWLHIPFPRPENTDEHARNWRELERQQQRALGEFSPYPLKWLGSTSNGAINNGQLVGLVRDHGPQAWLLIYLKIGSTSTLPIGSWSLTLPYTARADIAQSVPGTIHSGTIANRRPISGYISAKGTTVARINYSAGSVTNAAPFAWATGDELLLQGFYAPLA